MKIEHIDIKATLENAQRLIDEDDQMSVGTKSVMQMLVVIVSLLAGRMNLDSTNSSKPPSSDPNTG